jgi:phage tail protein X
MVSNRRRFCGGSGAVSGTGAGAGAGSTAGAGATSATLKSNDGLSTFHTYLYNRIETKLPDIFVFRTRIFLQPVSREVLL